MMYASCSSQTTELQDWSNATEAAVHERLSAKFFILFSDYRLEKFSW